MADEAQSGAKPETKVNVGYPYDVFEHGISGLEPLTREPIEVSSSQLKKLREVAKAEGIPLEETKV